jgi:hypothetical protein
MLTILPPGVIPYESFELENTQGFGAQTGFVQMFIVNQEIVLLREKTSSLIYLEELEISTVDEVSRPFFTWFFRVSGVSTRHLENRKLTQTANQKTFAFPRIVVLPQTEITVSGILNPAYVLNPAGPGLDVQVILRGSLLREVRPRR